MKAAKALLTQYQQDEHGRESEKAGDFPEALKHPDFPAGKRCRFNDKIVQQSLPDRKAQSRMIGSWLLMKLKQRTSDGST